MINFEILGTVTARQDEWAADLKPQQQLLLAKLVIARGALVRRADLEEALWDLRMPYPDGGLKRVVAELRAHLRPTLPDGGPEHGGGGAYRLPLAEQQADVLRFRAKTTEAYRREGQESVTLMHQALREWGPDAAGLHGGYPLSGLMGIWAGNTRDTLRAEYRDAVVHCLRHDTDSGRHDLVLRECDQLAAAGLEALHDEEFLELWMRAAYCAGQRARAEQIFRRAADSAAHLDSPLGGRLQRLAELIRDEDPRLSGPGDVPAPAASYPISKINDGSMVSDPNAIFSNSDQVKVGSQIYRNDGSLIIHMESGPDSAEDPPDQPERAEGADQEGTPG